ncbi:uncharacterized protein LACBIDRAFT_329329 [Laccaria bicolor S238N-H82]|uniref:Predicted protein n=1 Tax=Laccaria bicolor (strain S238N-H82 / ATCC MYA-4686) TaxID=486041 RepID=B0DHP5_LACBS|nr:uncharacterized protein LACBIDRAFT_329329 [Laccaria bicolor S238N-H82]EDR05872.1 predicted protein [Laccaria bicolor S238N-H82]|eukprot:XP_001883548.1 predicted protein [Laccaria bicolor S238N-H82]
MVKKFPHQRASWQQLWDIRFVVYLYPLSCAFVLDDCGLSVTMNQLPHCQQHLAHGFVKKSDIFNIDYSHVNQVTMWARPVFAVLFENVHRTKSDGLHPEYLTTSCFFLMECGTPNVPSFKALRKKQKDLTEQMNVQPKMHTSAMGNTFWMNHPIDLLALDWANPLVRDFIHVYPEMTSTVSESWQAAKYLEEVSMDELSPMWADWEHNPHRHFYVGEIAQLCDNRFVIPVRWILFKKVVHAEVYQATRNEVGLFVLHDPQIFRVEANTLRYNLLDLQVQYTHVSFHPPHLNHPHLNVVQLPHPVREIAAGRPVFVLRIMPWADDVSGNRSKQYNAHMNIYVANVNLPHWKLAQEFFVRFVSTSPHASSSEQFDALSEDIKSDSWHPAYDCTLKEEILFRLRAHVLPADNPQQAESSSNAGSNANYWCRADMSGGPDEPGTPCTPEETITSIKNQIWTACLGSQEAVDTLQTKTGVKDRTAIYWIQQLVDKAREMQQDHLYKPGIRDARLDDRRIKGPEREAIKAGIKTDIQKELYEWVFTQPAERYEEIPIDDLLLGVNKYIWYQTNKVWDKKKDELFATRLQSSSIDGLTLSPLRAHYMAQYKNSLIGKHFKALQQLGVFHLHDDLCSKDLLNLWKANGELGAMTWFPEIKDMDSYLSDLEVLINNVLDLWAVVDPSHIQYKYKLHVLPHLKEDIRRFGPAVLFATEVFECWNAVFRLCSVLSNHQAPSHDIAVTLADMERFKHQVSGGWWKDSCGNYTQAGTRVRSFLLGNKELQRRLGWVNTANIQAGSVKLKSKTTQDPKSWRDALGAAWTAETDKEGTWIVCKHVISIAQDVCMIGSWVFLKDSCHSLNLRRKGPKDAPAVHMGCILNILAPKMLPQLTAGTVVLVELFNISGANDPHLNMPVLTPSGGTVSASPEHDCQGCGCTAVELLIRQGRDMTQRTRKTIQHADNARYFINTHALHNANLLRETLPRELTKPVPYFADRRAQHE